MHIECIDLTLSCIAQKQQVIILSSVVYHATKQHDNLFHCCLLEYQVITWSYLYNETNTYMQIHGNIVSGQIYILQMIDIGSWLYILLPLEVGGSMLVHTWKHGLWSGDWWFVTALFHLFWAFWQFTHYLCVTDLLQPVLPTGSSKAAPCVIMSMWYCM